jgi:hypothetical protein
MPEESDRAIVVKKQANETERAYLKRLPWR